MLPNIHGNSLVTKIAMLFSASTWMNMLKQCIVGGLVSSMITFISSHDNKIFYCSNILRSYDGLKSQPLTLIEVEQTKIIHYNLPGTTAH